MRQGAARPPGHHGNTGRVLRHGIRVDRRGENQRETAQAGGGTPLPPFTSIHMTSAIRGWGVTSRAVFRTTDGGRRWTNVLTPAAAPGVSLSADFLGGTDAWVATSDAGRVELY